MFRIEVELVAVTDTHATFTVTRAPDLKTNTMVIGGMMATVLKAEAGGEYADWMGRLAPYATTPGATWQDRLTVTETEEVGLRVVKVRFWTDDDSVFKLQPDGSYAARMSDLVPGARRGPVTVKVQQQGQQPRKGRK